MATKFTPGLRHSGGYPLAQPRSRATLYYSLFNMHMHIIYLHLSQT